MKGSATLSESIVMGFSIIISFILVVLVIRTVLSYQADRSYENLFESIARDIALTIDRTVSMSSSGNSEYRLPKGARADITIDYKYVFVKYGDQIVRKSYSGLIDSIPYSFEEPEALCFVKEDNKIRIFDTSCDQVI